MLCSILPVAGSLAPTKTHAKGRRWVFLPSADPTSPSLGTLTIVQSKRDTAGYGIAVEGGQILFCKMGGTAEVYGVDCTMAGVPARCTCDGWHFSKRSCKHMDAAREMIADGVLDLGRPAPAAWAPTCSADLQGGF